MDIFDKRAEHIITELKIKSFEMQQDISDDGGDNKEAKAQEQAAKKVKQDSDENSNEDDDDGSGDDEEAEGDEGGRGANDLAYKSQDINDDLMKDELFGLRDRVWKVLGNIYNQYDFGMV